MEKMTREEALREAKFRMITSGAGDEYISSKGGYWYNKVTGEKLTQDEAYALIPDEKIDEAYIYALMNDTPYQL